MSHPIDVDRTEHYQLVNLAEPTHNTGVEFLGTLRKAAFSATAQLHLRSLPSV